MADQFIGEIRMFAGSFAPKGWAFCNGQLLPLSQNPVLFSIIGTGYGGDGKKTFALPDLMGRVPMHQGEGSNLTARSIGKKVGTSTVTLLESQIPNHSHQVRCDSGVAQSESVENGIWARSTQPTYSASSPNVQMSAQALHATGGGMPHNNMQPYLGLSFIIALQGVYPAMG